MGKQPDLVVCPPDGHPICSFDSYAELLRFARRWRTDNESDLPADWILDDGYRFGDWDDIYMAAVRGVDAVSGGEANPVAERQIGGTHYERLSIQPTEYAHANGMGFIEGNIVKYVSRHRYKGGREDLLKALHYLNELIERDYPEAKVNYRVV